MLDEATLRFVKAVESSKLCNNRTKVNTTPNLSPYPRAEWAEIMARHQDGIDRQTFDQGALIADNIKHLTLRRSSGFFMTPVPTFEERETEANNLVPCTLKSKKEDVALGKIQYEEAIGYLQESISKESREQTKSGAVGHFYGSGFQVKVRSSEYRYQFIPIRDWNTYEAETKDKIALLTAWRDFLNTLNDMYDRKIKEREDPKAVKEIIAKAKSLNKKRGHTIQRIRRMAKQSIEFKTAKIFVEELEKKRVIEAELHTLENRFDWFEKTNETVFPPLYDELTSDDLRNRKKTEGFYQNEREKRKVGGTKA